jgi:proline iminopeptidase
MRRLTPLVLAACGGGMTAAPAPEPAPPAAVDPRLAPGDHVAQLDGQPLAYHVAGQGPPCIAWPGGPGLDSGYLRSPELERHATVIYVDPAGTGGSARLEDPAGYGKRRYVEDLEKLRAALGLESPCLLGHSYGGLVVMLYAITHPTHAGRLILYDATPRLDAEFAAAARVAMQRSKGTPWYADAMAAFTARPGTDEEATALLMRTAPLYFADWNRGAAAYAAALGRSRVNAAAMTAPERAPYDLRIDLPKIGAPALVLAGRHDFICGPGHAAEIANLILDARLHVFEKSGHFAHLEEPGEFERVVADFLR